MPNLPLELLSKLPINLSQTRSQHILMLTSRTPGTTSIKTTRDGLDTKRPTPSRDISMETLTSLPPLQDLLVTLTPEVPTTFSHIQMVQKPLQLVQYEKTRETIREIDVVLVD